MELFLKYKTDEVHCNFEEHYETSVKERDFDQKSLAFTYNTKCEYNGQRPYLEPGAPESSLDLFFNRLNFRKTVIEQRGSAYNTTNLNPEEKENGNKIAQDRVDKFFQLMSPDGNTGTNSFKTIKKCIDDPAQTNIVHYLNNDYLTFVFNSEQIDEYFKYVKQKFYLPFDYIYSQEATLTYDESKEVEIEGTSYTNKSNFNWMVKEPYHLFDNYYAMAIDGIVSKRDYENLLSGDMHYFVNKLIEDFSTFDFDWNTYPGNLYVGSVCKILS